MGEVERRGLAVEHLLYANTLARLMQGELSISASETAAVSPPTPSLWCHSRPVLLPKMPG
ncbi:hypothetical protein MUN84_09480 [Hymenobacter sp. 5516J-16]|uniref:hypothetical protein n=1 Tax=Hymenobacter sp. 5516J-16 TaxID=2932253 RepID=UPI001FD1FF20|nr:hypothetical protein [Hymenobacter sp. 5516J-16]UOQ78736.1 hypothetical protein MUN84_09480 [Hymenobacter sp. 5516J-16]